MRVVSLCPSTTETVFDLGRGDRLVGRTRYCIEPAGEVEAVEEVGGTKDPDVARIVELGPDLVLLNEEENRVEDHDELVVAGVPCHVGFPRAPADVPELLRDLGRRLEAEEEAEAHARALERALAAARPARETSFVYVIWRKPWMLAGRDTFVGALLETVGGRNAWAADGARYPTFEPEGLRALDPERVLLSSEPFPFQQRHADELSARSGLARERFRLVDGQDLSWHGTRTLRGVATAVAALSRGGTLGP